MSGRSRVRRSGQARRAGLLLVAAVLLTACGSTSGQDDGTTPTADTAMGVPSMTQPIGVVGDAEVLKQIPYAATSSAQVLHLSLPPRTGQAIPLVVLVHGGGYETGDKGDLRFLVEALNARGYATAAINYRLSGEATFPAGVQDTKAAIRWLRTYAPVHGIDPNQIAVWGLSAGGTLAALAGVSGDQDGLLDDDALGWASASSAVQAVVAWYAPTDFLTMDTQAVDPGGCPGVADLHDPVDSPESRWLGAAVQSVPDLVAAATPASYLAAARDIPPFYLAHGDRDCTVPFAQTLEFADALRAAGASVTVNIVPGAGHAEGAFDRAQIDPSIAFLDKVFGRTS